LADGEPTTQHRAVAHLAPTDEPTAPGVPARGTAEPSRAPDGTPPGLHRRSAPSSWSPTEPAGAARAPVPPVPGDAATPAEGALDLVGRVPVTHRSVAAQDQHGSDDVVGEVVTASPGESAGPGAGPPAPPDAPADLAGLADRLWDHLEQRLRRSLLLERERRGVLPDL